MMSERIRIRLKAYDHRVLDQSVREIVDAVKRTGGRVAGPHSPRSLSFWRSWAWSQGWRFPGSPHIATGSRRKQRPPVLTARSSRMRVRWVPCEAVLTATVSITPRSRLTISSESAASLISGVTTISERTPPRALVSVDEIEALNPSKIVGDVFNVGGHVSFEEAQFYDNERTVPVSYDMTDVMDLTRPHNQKARIVVGMNAQARKGPNDRFYAVRSKGNLLIGTVEVMQRMPPDDAVQVLREMNRLSQRGFILNDLRRSRGGYLAAQAAAKVTTRNRLTRNDAPLSVLRAYTPAELREVYDDATAFTPESVDGERRYVILFKPGEAPTGEDAAAVNGYKAPGEAAMVKGRAVHVWIDGTSQGAQVFNELKKPLAPGTNRTTKVLETLVRKWL